MKITAQTKICMVIGDPVVHSLSPQMHNAGYKELHRSDQFVYVACEVKPENLEQAIKGVKALGIRGVSVTVPHKQTVMQHLDAIDPVAKKIGAVNTIVNANGKLIGYNTDWLGILAPLEEITEVQNKTVAILGAGGGARAVAYAISTKKGKLTFYNRTLEKAQELAEEFGGIAYSLEKFETITSADIIINATSVGLKIKTETPLSKKLINKNHIVFDIIYGKETQLLKDAKEQGAQTIAGIEMLLQQGIAQFKLFTGLDAPVEIMRRALI